MPPAVTARTAAIMFIMISVKSSVRMPSATNSGAAAMAIWYNHERLLAVQNVLSVVFIKFFSVFFVSCVLESTEANVG